MRRRNFLKVGAGGVFASLLSPSRRARAAETAVQNPVFSVTDVPDGPFYDPAEPNRHAGVDSLLTLMGENGLKFYRSNMSRLLSGPPGLIASGDVVLVKVNAQWKYRGATNSDVVRGIIQRILDHPDGFTGEIVIIENGQGRGSLKCDTSSSYDNAAVHANAVDERHSFVYLVDSLFKDRRVSAYLLDSIRAKFIGEADHGTDGYRKFENVSYPCFTTANGRRVELKDGIWNGSGYDANLKLLNVPVLKTHGGSEITASLKHFYGILTMNDGQSPFRHYGGLGETCGKMVAAIRTPVLNILDAVWVSHKALEGYPAASTFKANQLAAGQDPLALDYWAAKNILYPINKNANHHPDNATISAWMDAAGSTINSRGGLLRPQDGILIGSVTRREEEMLVRQTSARLFAESRGNARVRFRD